MKRVLPRAFPLSASDWEEIYNALESDGVQKKLPPDGRGMADDDRKQARLSEKDWIEIYLSVEDKYKHLKSSGDYGDGIVSREGLREWKRQMVSILGVLDEVRAHFIGGEARG